MFKLGLTCDVFDYFIGHEFVAGEFIPSAIDQHLCTVLVLFEQMLLNAYRVRAWSPIRTWSRLTFEVKLNPSRV